MKTKFLFAAIISIAFLSVNAQSGKRSLQDENRRIRQGVKSGQLTATEAARLKTQEARLKREAIRYKRNDGVISPVERADLKRDNKKLNRNIYRQKHDRQRRH